MKTKLTPKQKQEKKEFIKKQIFKIIHVIGYVCIFLVALFSILMSVQSCNKKPNNRNASNLLDHNTQLRVNDNSYNGYNQYELYYRIYDNNGSFGIYNSEFDFDLDYCLNNFVNNEIFAVNGVTRVEFCFHDTSFFSVYFKSDLNFWYRRDLLVVDWSTPNILKLRGYNHGNTSEANLFTYDYVNKIVLHDELSMSILKYDKDENESNIQLFGYDSNGNARLSVANMFNHDDRVNVGSAEISYGFENLYANTFPIQYENFIFVDNFNPNSLFSNVLQGAINLGQYNVLTYMQNYSWVIKAPRSFICNGKVYNALRIPIISLDSGSTRYTTDGETSKTWNLAGNYGYVAYVSYENDLLGYSDIVITCNYVNFGNSTGVYLNSFRWTNITYKNITFLDKDYKIPSNFLSQNDFDALSVLNNGNNNQIGNITTYSLGTSNNNVFVWLRGAFSSLTDIFAISLLPGVTIGILIFLPMVVTIIIVIFKLIKK